MRKIRIKNIKNSKNSIRIPAWPEGLRTLTDTTNYISIGWDASMDVKGTGSESLWWDGPKLDHNKEVERTSFPLEIYKKKLSCHVDLTLVIQCLAGGVWFVYWSGSCLCFLPFSVYIVWPLRGQKGVKTILCKDPQCTLGSRWNNRPILRCPRGQKPL